MRKIAGYLTKNRNEKDQKIAQSTHENGYIQSGRTFCRNSKQLLSIQSADILVQVREFFLHLNFDYESHIYNKVYTVFQSLPSPPLFSVKVFKSSNICIILYLKPRLFVWNCLVPPFWMRF